MPPPVPRFAGGPATISPYHQQFPGHGQGHPSNQHSQLANSAYLTPNQLGPFTANGGLSLGGGLGAGVGFGVGAESGLASQAARLGFAHGAHLQQQHQHQHQQHVLNEPHHTARNQGKTRIREVWKHNLVEEMAMLRDLVDKYPYNAMVREHSQKPNRADNNNNKKNSSMVTRTNAANLAGYRVPR